LPAKHERVIYLRFYVDDSLEGIAAALGCSVGTVKSRLFHALERGQTVGWFRKFDAELWFVILGQCRARGLRTMCITPVPTYGLTPATSDGAGEIYMENTYTYGLRLIRDGLNYYVHDGKGLKL